MAQVTNQEVFDFCQANGRNKCIEYLIESNNCNEQPSKRAYEKSIEKFLQSVKNVKRSSTRRGDSTFDSFLKESFSFPKKDSQKSVPKVTSDDCLDASMSLKEEKRKSLEVFKENKQLEDKVVFLEEKASETQKKLENKEKKLVECKKQLKRTAAREQYINKKVCRLETNVTGECCAESKTRIAVLEEQLREKEQEIRELNTNIQVLQEIIDEQRNDAHVNEVILFDDKSKTYSPKLKQCVYEVLKLQVSASKVSSVIKAVLNLVGLSANKLPSRTTVLEMNLQRLYLAQVQICEVFAKDEGTVLMTDETSKFGSKYMGYEASDSSGTLWVLGLRDIQTKSAADTLQVFQQLLEDLDDKSAQDGNTTSRNIVTHIIATLSDRAATEVKFNSLLYDFRKEILPLTFQNYDQFSAAEKSSLETICNFFCGLHALVNFAEASKSTIKQVESDVFDGETPCHNKSYRDSDPGVCRLVRTASKAFGVGSGGDEKSGCQGHFKTFAADFLQEHHMRTVPLRSYRGTRFNILFSNAAAVFFLHTIITEFLDKYGAGNQLLQSVLFDLKTPEFVAGAKALGLISKFVTCPLWTVLEDKNISITDMNEKYLQLVNYLDESSNDIQAFMTGELLLFGNDTYIEKDAIYNSLVTSDQYDNITEVYLQVLLPALSQVSKRLFENHLPGGSLENIAPNIKDKLKHAPKTSSYAESVFGQLDHLLRTKPNMSTLAAEASIMFLNNKTSEWLNTKSEEERKVLFKKASRSVANIRNVYKARLLEIETNRRNMIQEQIRKRENARQEHLRKQEEYTKQIINHGLWQTTGEVDNMLESYENNSQKMEALKAQLKFRKTVLQQIPDNKQVYNVTKSNEGSNSRKALSVEELTNNLKELVRQAIVKDDNEDRRHILVGKRVKHKFVNDRDGTVEWFPGKVISQVPSFPEWFNIVYDGDSAVYTYHHLEKDMDNADLQIVV